MFVAQDKEGNLVNSLTFTKETLQQMKSQTFFCPVCRSALIIKKGMKKRIHFAHKTKECSQGMKESITHLLAKEKLFHFFSSKNIPIQIEYPIKETNQRADLFIVLGNREYVIEFQHSTISQREISARITSYANLNLYQIWLIDPKLIRKKNNVFLLQPFQTEILKSCSPSVLRLYNPHMHSLTILHSILYIHATKIIAQEETYLLNKSSISCFFSFQPKITYQFKKFFYQIELEKKNILQYYQSNQGFVYSLYNQQLVLTSLWWVGLPTKYNNAFSTSCIIWQGYIYLLIKEKKYLTIEQCYKSLARLMNKGNIRISIEEDEIIKMAIQHYLDLLEKLTIIVYEEDHYHYLDSFFEKEEDVLVSLLLQTL